MQSLRPDSKCFITSTLRDGGAEDAVAAMMPKGSTFTRSKLE